MNTSTPTSPTPTATPVIVPPDNPPAPAPKPIDVTPTEPTGPVEQPMQPVIPETSEADTISSYQPTFKEGVHVVDAVISDFGPWMDKETGDFRGWSLVADLTAEFPNDSGGSLPVGHRIYANLFTLRGQFDRDDEKVKRQWVANLQGLNGIVRDKRTDPKFDAADAALRSLPATKKLPLRMDIEQSHYDQWKGTPVKLLVNQKADRTNVNEILAASTPSDAKRR